MNSMKRVAASAAIAGALGVCALGIGDAVANAAPPGPGATWAQQPPPWIPGPGPGGPGGPWGGGPGWGGPPPPPPAPIGYGGYGGYGGWDDGWRPPCLSGPLGFLQLCV
jgi:hypothetical protein